MRNLITRNVLVLVSVLAIGSLVSCNDDSSEVSPVEPQEPRMVDIGFGLSLTPSGKAMAKNAEDLHTYITDGYTITITGGIDPDYANHTEVDLTQNLSIKVVGDIVVTVSHPSFDGNVLDIVAYYGANEVPVATGSSDVNSIELELVQGFVMVTADENLDQVVTGVEILGQTSDLDVVYYTAVPTVDVLVDTTGDSLTGQHSNVLGEGVQYNVTSTEDGIVFEFPEFGDPGDGIWNP